MKLRLLLVSNMYPSKRFPYYGTFIQTIEEAILETNEVEIDKIVLTKRENLFLKSWDYFCFLIKVIFALSTSNKYDIVHAHFLNHTLIPFLFLKKNKNVKWVLNGHGSDVFPEKKRGDILAKISKKVIYRADSIIVPSSYFKQEVVRKYLLDPRKVIVSASGGVDLDSFKPELDKPHYSKTIGYLGRIEENKGINLFLDAFQNANVKDLSAKIAGTGTLVKNLKERMEGDLSIHSIRYVGPIAKRNVPRFFKDVDLFLFLSDRKGESLGLTALEALASGCPVIALDRGAVGDFVFHGENGYLLLDKDPRAIALCIDHFFGQSRSDIQKMRKRSRDVAKNYDSSYIARSLVGHYHQLLQTPN